MERIWFNRWFSTAGHYIEMIKNNSEGKEFYIIGSHPSGSVYFDYCDESFIEEDLKGDDYVNYCLEVCKEKSIDIFIPRKEATMIAKHIEKFEVIGVKVMVAPYDIINTLEDKILMNDILIKEMKKGTKIIDVPESYEATTADEFLAHYRTLRANDCLVCVKPVRGEGGLGFWKIVDTEQSFEDIQFATSTNKIQVDRFYQMLKDYELKGNKIPELMVLEYLGGPEYSIDCLADKDGNLLVAIPRGKGRSGRVRILEDNKEFIELAHKLADKFKIPYIYNIQFRVVDGIPKFLEINARMSGGMYMSCLSGVNMPYVALKALKDEKLTEEDLNFNLGLEITYMENPRILNQ